MERRMNTLDLTEQQTFDFAFEGVVAQGCRSFDPDLGICQYNYGQMHCAVGHIVSKALPEAAQRLMEGVGIAGALQSAGIKASWPSISFMSDLQTIHDADGQSFVSDEDYVRYYIKEMRLFAVQHGLEFNHKES